MKQVIHYLENGLLPDRENPSQIHLKLKSSKISFAHNARQSMNSSEVLLKAWQCDCCSLYIISEGFAK